MRKLPKTCKACNLCYTDGGKRETGRRLSASAKRFVLTWSGAEGGRMKLAPPAGAEPCKGRMCPRVPFKSLFACKKRLLLKKQCGGGLRPPHAVLFSPQSRRANFARHGFLLPLSLLPCAGPRLHCILSIYRLQFSTYLQFSFNNCEFFKITVDFRPRTCYNKSNGKKAPQFLSCSAEPQREIIK